ncbi:MAG: hypothetical protein A3F43_04880 [Gammaproteobacteria bacterium RIFCSPHIGHO2_12_FULL_42_10]|nr:MAG: hypothetical protein A3F43_04880 [Gammaproteobacteria bacterium RIFCSPHIGHO2_12_FULL_42_10]
MIVLIRKYFISGLLVWLPIWITVLAINFLVDILSKSLLLLPARYQPDVLLGVHIPGIGVMITVVVIIATGLFAANFIGRYLVALGDAIVARIPIVRSIYTGVKQVTQTLLTPGGQSFRKVLLVEFPCPGVFSLAFQTGEVHHSIQHSMKDQEAMVSYFIPTTPNPTSGFLMMAPRSQVTELDMSVDQALKFVISLGVMQPVRKSSQSEDEERKIQ